MSKPMTLAGRSRLPRCAGPHHADDAAGGPGKDRVLALEAARLGQPARRLHEVEAHARHLGRHLVDVAAQDRREIGVDHRRVAAADQLHQRADAVRDAHLREAGRARERLGRRFVRGEALAVHEDDRDAAQPGREGGFEIGAERAPRRARARARRWRRRARRPRSPSSTAARAARCAARTGAAGPDRRCASASRKPLRDDEQRRLALALEQRVGGHRRAHLHALDRGRA